MKIACFWIILGVVLICLDQWAIRNVCDVSLTPIPGTPVGDAYLRYQPYYRAVHSSEWPVTVLSLMLIAVGVWMWMASKILNHSRKRGLEASAQNNVWPPPPNSQIIAATTTVENEGNHEAPK